MRAWLTLIPTVFLSPRQLWLWKLAFVVLGMRAEISPATANPLNGCTPGLTWTARIISPLSRRLPPSKCNSVYCPEKTQSDHCRLASQHLHPFPRSTKYQRQGLTDPGTTYFKFKKTQLLNLSSSEGKVLPLHNCEGSLQKRAALGTAKWLLQGENWPENKSGQWETLIIAWHEHIQPQTRTQKRWE